MPKAAVLRSCPPLILLEPASSLRTSTSEANPDGNPDPVRALLLLLLVVLDEDLHAKTWEGGPAVLRMPLNA